MDRRQLAETVCARYCAFFKPGKDETEACRGLLVIGELSGAWQNLASCEGNGIKRRETEEYLCAVLCAHCAFSPDGCDFAAWKRGELAPDREGAIPCGGFLFLGSCLEQGTLDIQALNGVI